MEVADLMKRLADYGKSKTYFTETTIGKLDKSCCMGCGLKVYDFDKCEELVRKKNDSQSFLPYLVAKPTLKSCKTLEAYLAAHFNFI